MLKGDTLAHTEMVECYTNKIRMQYEFMLGRYRPEPSPFHQYPVHAAEDEPVRKGPGRPKGSKNRIAKKETESEIKEKRKPGRPPGAKNKKTLEKEAAVEKQHVAAKRGPGRPKGSRNQPKTENETPERKRGRPKKRDK